MRIWIASRLRALLTGATVLLGILILLPFLDLQGPLEGLAVLYVIAYFLILLPLAGAFALGWKWRVAGARIEPLLQMAPASSSRESSSGLPVDDYEDDYLEEEKLVAPNMGAIWLALAAAALAIVSVFLPRVESDVFTRIAENSLIQGGDGWIIIGCAIGIAGATYRAYRDHTRSWAVLVLGLIILGFAIYAGTGERLELTSASTNFFEGSVTDTGTPGIGVYAAGVAGLMALTAGWMLAGRSVSSFETKTEGRTKTCPECAETILGAARVCKHCGYRFAPPS